MPIYFVQHGVAVPEEVDSNRPLSAEGRRQVERIAVHLRKAGVAVKKVYHSGKTRARETAQIYAERLGDGALSEVPGMNPNDDVRSFAAGLKEDDTMYVGHLPHLGKLVSYLVAGDEHTGVIKFVNGGVVCVEKGSAGYQILWSMIPSLCDLQQPEKERVRPMLTGQHPYSSRIKFETAGHISGTVELNYLLHLPSDYGGDPHEKWPLILFLHGSGERGNDLELLKRQPLPKTLEQQKDFPFIVLSPQLPLALANWSELIDPVKALLDQIQASYSVDSQRVYLTGLSMGGFGAWEFALRYPRRIAAMVPIAGGYRFQSHAIPENICDLKDLPVWVFHGAQDVNVLPSQSEEMVKALEACGGKVRFTLYPDADHSASWTRAYADPELYAWLLEKTLKGLS